MQLLITGQNQEKKLKGYVGGQKKKRWLMLFSLKAFSLTSKRDQNKHFEIKHLYEK